MTLRATRTAPGASGISFVTAMLLGLHLGPLVGGEDAAQAEEHLGVGLFEVRAEVGDLRDLGEALGLVGRIGV